MVFLNFRRPSFSACTTSPNSGRHEYATPREPMEPKWCFSYNSALDPLCKYSSAALPRVYTASTVLFSSIAKASMIVF